MDTWLVAPALDRLACARDAARFGAAGLALRLAALRRTIERDYPVAVTIDLVNQEAAEGLPPDLTETVHALLHEAVLNAVRHAGASLVRLTIRVDGGSVHLAVADDGKGFAFKGAYGLGELTAFGAGPRVLVDGIAGLGGTMTLDSGETGTRIAMTVPRQNAPRRAYREESVAARAAG